MAALVTVKIYSTQPEADIAKGLLEQNGISVVIRADVRPSVAFASGIALQVKDSDAKEAIELLEKVGK